MIADIIAYELDNKMAGRSTKENTEYFKRVLDAPCEAFAKYFTIVILVITNHDNLRKLNYFKNK